MVGTISGLIVIGLIAGLIARAIVFGRQHMDIGATMLLGIIGSFVAASSIASFSTTAAAPRGRQADQLHHRAAVYLSIRRRRA